MSCTFDGSCSIQTTVSHVSLCCSSLVLAQLHCGKRSFMGYLTYSALDIKSCGTLIYHNK